MSSCRDGLLVPLRSVEMRITSRNRDFVLKEMMTGHESRIRPYDIRNGPRIHFHSIKAKAVEPRNWLLLTPSIPSAPLVRHPSLPGLRMCPDLAGKTQLTLRRVSDAV